LYAPPSGFVVVIAVVVVDAIVVVVNDATPFPAPSLGAAFSVVPSASPSPLHG
jgi:hypothetical protein